MATYYLLPHRSLVHRHLQRCLATFFPGIVWTEAGAEEAAEAITEILARHSADVYVVYREELPADEPLACSLVEGFGAEPGDRVIEVALNDSLSMSSTWTVPEPRSAFAA